MNSTATLCNPPHSLELHEINYDQKKKNNYIRNINTISQVVSSLYLYESGQVV